MRLERTVDPLVNAVTTALVEQQLYLSANESPLVVANAIEGAIMKVEQDTDRSLISQTWVMTLDRFPNSFWEHSVRHYDYATIFIPKGKVQSVVSLTYIDADGDEQALVEDTDYTITTIGDEARIEPINSWPATSSNVNDTVKFTWVSGYGDADTDVPAWTKQAILLLMKEYFDGDDVHKSYQRVISRGMLFFDSEKNDR